MAVYTEVSDEEVAAFVADYTIGDVIACKGIAEGVENSNYLLVTTEGRFILTLYEKRVAEADLPFFVALMEHLASRGIRCPLPLATRDGETLRRLAGRPAAIVTFLDGMWPRRVQPAHCLGLGRGLAEMHQAGADFAMARVNDLSVAGWRPLFDACGPGTDSVAEGLAAALSAELDVLEQSWPSDLPSGVIHADLFPDNVFFRDTALSGLIDFYFACTDLLAYDIAICLNAWCFEIDGAFNITKARALLSAYHQVRPVTPAELAVLPILARGAAIRFLLTRLYDWLNVPDGALVKPKDPLEYWKKLRFHQQVDSVAAYGLDP